MSTGIFLFNCMDLKFGRLWPERLKNVMRKNSAFYRKNMDEQKNKTISFGLSKRSEKKIIGRSKFSDVSDVKEETDFITSLEDQSVKSLKPKEEKKEIIIPLIKTNNWKNEHVRKAKTEKTPFASEGNEVDAEAIKEIMQDTAKQLDTWQTRGVVDPNIEIPLLMQNKVPEGFETDEHLDVSLRPDGPEDTDYDEVPIEAFGMAMLKGMGWKPGTGIGKNNKDVAPVEAVLRPKGMGLGADRKQAQTLNSAKQGGNSNKTEESGELTMKKGAHCLIENGPHKDLYAVIEGLDEDNARLMLKLTVSSKLVTVSQYNIKLVTKEEYNKYSKYINKGAADRYKEREESRKEKKQRDSDRENESHRENKHRKEEDRLSPDDDKSRDKHDRKKDKQRDKDRSNKKRKYEDDRSHYQHTSSSSYTNGSTKSQSSIWVRPKLRVRLVDEQYKKGKYYNYKVVIVDVSDRDHCMCKTEDGKILEDISQSMLETMVPKSDSSYISIVTGKHRGQLGHVLERDKKKCQALVQLLSDRDKVLQLDYDSICEYVGNIDEEFDF